MFLGPFDIPVDTRIQYEARLWQTHAPHLVHEDVPRARLAGQILWRQAITCRCHKQVVQCRPAKGNAGRLRNRYVKDAVDLAVRGISDNPPRPPVSAPEKA